MKERVFYPSVVRVVFIAYFAPGLALLGGLGFRVLLQINSGQAPTVSDWDWGQLFIFWLVWAGLNALVYGLRAERFAIRVTASAIAGPIAVGRAEPIPFVEIDFQKTHQRSWLSKVFNGPRVCSIHGDQIELREWLFRSEQMSDIRSVLREAERRKSNNAAS